METIDLKQCIAHGENTTTEFKENFDQETIETAAAFANTDGGIILIGVSDSGEIRGITIGKETLRDCVKPDFASNRTTGSSGNWRS